MALNADDLRSIYLMYENNHEEVVGIEALALLEGMFNCNFDPTGYEKFLDEALAQTRGALWVSKNWKDIRQEKKIPVIESLKRMLFCPFEDVPLYVNDKHFSAIIKWRLAHGK